MRSGLTTVVFVLLVGVAAVVCFGPWYETDSSLMFMALVKLAALLIGALGSFLVHIQIDPSKTQSRAWLRMAIGLLLFASAQSVLAYHQIILNELVPFPSAADPQFVAGTILLIWALFEFCIYFARSGISLGRLSVFWSPAMITAVVFVCLVPPLLAPVASASGSAAETFLNLFYPIAGFALLAAGTVALRVGVLMRGGKLLNIWVPITLGVVTLTASDILFSYLTSLDITGIESPIDFLYIAGYLLIARGVLSQLEMMHKPNN